MVNGLKTVLSDKRPGGTYEVSPQAEPLQVTQIRHAADLFAFREAWRDLAGGVPMQSPEWLLVWLK